jgi:hypothetical protein
MSNSIGSGILLSLAMASVGCSFMARAPEQYRDDTRALLETRNPQVKQCYDEALRQNPTLAGQVAVQFTVQPETGKVTNPSVVPGRTTAPEQLGQCVVQAIDGIALQPPDEREGQATFVYEFQVAPGGAVPAPPG